MFLLIFYAASFSTFLVLPFLYKSKRKSMRHLYYRMADQHAMRNMYSKMVMLFLIWFHFMYLNLTGNHYDLLPSTIICFTMFSHNHCERLFRFMQNRRTLWGAMLLTLTCLFIPHFLPLGYTFGTLLCAAVFYPSKIIREKMDDDEWQDELWLNDWHELPELYFKWDKTERDVCVKPKDVLEGIRRRWEKLVCHWNSKEKLDLSEYIDSLDKPDDNAKPGESGGSNDSIEPGGNAICKDDLEANDDVQLFFYDKFHNHNKHDHQ